MAQQKSLADCDSPDPNLLSVSDAKQRIIDSVATVQGIERMALRDALGRVLAKPIQANLDIPPMDNSAMDGYAVRAADLPSQGVTTLQLIGRSFAGAPFDGQVKAGQCVRIMTGAVMPRGADTVIMQEHIQLQAQGIEISAVHKPGQNVRHSGEDIAKGDLVMDSGHRLMAADIGVLASLGLAEVDVRRQVRVAFFSTGDELRGVGQALNPGDIYDSNRYTLFAMLTRLGVELLDMGVIPDQVEAVEQALLQASRNADVILTSGGVSVGEADFVKNSLEKLGQVDFWKVKMKPGKPLAVGTIGDARFFGLPGNPVSALVTFYQFVQPALFKIMGTTPPLEITFKAKMLGSLNKHPGRQEYQRGILSLNQEGEMIVTGSGAQGSHVLSALTSANCFIILAAENTGVADGEWVTVQPFAGII